MAADDLNRFGADRQRLDPEEVERLSASGVLVSDDRRRRPLWFDGRFLAARDLSREQRYVATRLADLSRAAGAGVVRGLHVQRGAGPSEIVVQPGSGVTPSGEIVLVPSALKVNLADLELSERLDVYFGLRQAARAPARGRAGVYALALRPVEFASRPVSSYPTRPDGQAGVQPGDIVEGTVLTLIPYASAESGAALEQARRKAERDIFVHGGGHTPQVDALPLALVGLGRGGAVAWLDVHLARRELGPEHGDLLGFGLASRAVREAFVLHYEARLREVMRAHGGRFAASEHFSCLPPVGRFPEASMDRKTFTEIYFPPGVDVELSIVPADEISALVEESLMLPPIDLEAGAEALENVSVQILVPIKRSQLDEIRSTLADLRRRSARAFRPSARRLPVQALHRFKLPAVGPDTTPTGVTEDAAWAAALAKADPSVGDGTWWYVRRRNLHYRRDVAGQPVDVDHATNRT